MVHHLISGSVLTELSLLLLIVCHISVQLTHVSDTDLHIPHSLHLPLYLRLYLGLIVARPDYNNMEPQLGEDGLVITT